MHAMQYELTLPADYDMEIIRKRIRDRGHRTDGFPGLDIKSYLIRERGVDDSPINQYAPFYVWHESAGMNRFLWGGGGFAGIVTDFGRPPVRHWVGVEHLPGPDVAIDPVAATKHVEPIPALTDPTESVDAARERLREQAKHPGVRSTVLAVDPERWELVHFTLWTETPQATPGTRYQVLHLSRGSEQ
jgi:hypothetical protein